jgi:hypothetical protein
MIKRIFRAVTQFILIDYVKASSCSVVITDRTINANAFIVMSFVPNDGTAFAEGKSLNLILPNLKMV